MRKVYELLKAGGSVEAALDLSVVFGDLDARPEALWSLLYLAGYLTTDDTEQPNSKDVVRRLRIPNLEIASLYRSEIIDRFAQIAPAVATASSTFTARLSTGTPAYSPRSWRTCC